MGHDEVGLKSLNPFSPRPVPPCGAGLRYHSIPVPPPLRDEKNPCEVGQVGRAKIAILTHTCNNIKFHKNYQNDKWLMVN